MLTRQPRLAVEYRKLSGNDGETAGIYDIKKKEYNIMLYKRKKTQNTVKK